MSAWDEITTPLPPMDSSPPRHGRIRLGETYVNASGKELPRAVDHFVVHSNDDGTTLPAAADAFHRVYGDAPDSIRAWLPGENPEDNLRAAYRLYGTRKLKRKCSGPPSAGGSGQAAQRLEDGTLQPCACECDSLPVDSKLRCSFGWELLLLLPDVSAGVWDIVSGSSIGWDRIARELQHAHSLAGTLHLLEVDVVLVPTHVNPVVKGVAQSKTIWSVSVRPTGNVRALLEGRGRFDINAAAPSETAIVAPERYALPPSSLDEAPDRLIHHDQFASQSATATGGSDAPAATPSTPASVPQPDPRGSSGGNDATAAGAEPTTTTPTAEQTLAELARSLVAALLAMPEDDRAELRRRIPIADGTLASAAAEILGARWVGDLPGLLVELRARDCTLAELEAQRIAEAAAFGAAAAADTLGPTASQQRAADAAAGAALPAEGEQATIPTPAPAAAGSGPYSDEAPA